MIAFELIIGPIVWWVLRARQWRWEEIAFHFSIGTTVVGIALGGATLLAWCIFGNAFGIVPATITVKVMTVIALSVVNPLFEEIIVLAYVVQAMRKRFGLLTAMNVSIAIRLLYHLYQGPLAVIPIALFGVLVTILYVRLGRLWPVVVAHSLLDFVELSGFDC